MLLQIDDKFRVTRDSSLQNFQLEKLEPVKEKKSGDVVRYEYKIIGFHGNSMKSVLHQYAKEALIDDDKLNNLNSVMNKLNEIERTIKKVVNICSNKIDIKLD